jgi:excisionase family DNA binding protein
MTVPQAAQKLGVSYMTVRREIRDGVLPALRVRGKFVVAPEDLEAYIERARCAAAPEPVPAAAGADDDDDWRAGG